MAITKRVDSSGRARYGASVRMPGERKQVWLGTFDRKKDAEAAEREAESRMMRLESVERPKDITIRDLCDRYLERLVAEPQTHKTYKFGIDACLSVIKPGTPVSMIGAEEIEQVVARLSAKGLSPKSVRTAITPLRNALAAGVRWGYLRTNPALGITNMPRMNDTKVVVLSPAEHLQFVSTAPEDYQTMFYVWPFLGLRHSEMRGLRIEDVDLKSRFVYARLQYADKHGYKELKTKGSKRRIVLSEPAALALEAWMPTLNSDVLFPGNDGGPMHSSSMYRAWYATREAAGMPEITPHDMRHTFAVWLLEAGVPIKYVQAQLGHSRASTTLDVYGHALKTDDSVVSSRLEAWYAGESG